MNYYLIEISEGDSSIAGKAIYGYGTLDEAKANFYTKLGNAMKSNLYTSELVMVINSNGGIHCSEKYVAPIPEPEVEPTEAVTE